jgi:hypothetical protein
VSLLEVAHDIAPSRLLRGKNLGSELLVGREKDLAAINAAWTGTAKKNILVIIAWAGVGKTSLAAHWAATKLAERNHAGIEAYFDWSFYRQGTRREEPSPGASHAASADLFLREALEFFGDKELAASNAGAWQRGERIAQLVAKRRALLVLDGLEPLQDARTGELHDEGLRALVRGLAAYNRGLCIIATRQRLPDLAMWYRTTAQQWELASLSKKAGAALLGRLGVKGSVAERQQLSDRLRGHALSLTLLGHYLRRAHHGDIRRVDCVDFEKLNDNEQGGHAFRVIAAYENWFTESGCAVEPAILRMLGLFDRPATPDCLAALRTPAIRGLSGVLASVSDDEWNKAVAQLVEMNLVEEQPWEAPHPIQHAQISSESPRSVGLQVEKHHLTTAGYVLDAHPLIREYFAKRLRDQSSWREGHQRLYLHLRDTTPEFPDTLEGLLPLCHAVIHGCKAGLFQAALDEIFWSRIRRETAGYTWKKLGAFGADMMALSSFFVMPWTHPAPQLSEEDQIFVLHEAGFILQAGGNLTEALGPLRAALELRIQSGNRSEAAISAVNLSNVLLVLGDLRAAADCAREAVALVSGGVDVYQWEVGRAMLAFVLNQAGDIASAEALFCDQSEAASNSKPDYPFIDSLTSVYCDLLLVRNAYDEIERRAKDALKRAVEERWLLQLAWANFYLAEVEHWREGKNPTASGGASLAYVDAAVQAFRDSGYQDELVRGLLMRGELRAERGLTVKAKADVAEAEGIARRGGMRLHLADIHLRRALLLRNKHDLTRAREIIEGCAYWRRRRDLENAERAAVNW